MPNYEYRCKKCKHRFSLSYKTYEDYDKAESTCPQCGSAELSHLITGVILKKPSHDYTTMAPEEMLSVMDSGDSRQMGELFQQVGGEETVTDPQFHEVTERLLKGESINRIEKDLQASEKAGSSSETAD